MFLCLLKHLAQSRVPTLLLIPLDDLRYLRPLADQDTNVLRARYRRVEKIALHQECAEAFVHRHDDDARLTPLELVDRDGIGQLQIVLPEREFDQPPRILKGHVHLPVFLVDVADEPNVAVDDFEFVVVFHLDHFVANAHCCPGGFRSWVQPILEGRVERVAGQGCALA